MIKNRLTLYLFFLLLIMMNCSQESEIDIKPFDKISDQENNDTYQNSSPVQSSELIVGFFNQKESGIDKDYYKVNFDQQNTAYQIILTAVPGIDSKITFFTQEHRFLFTTDENGIGEMEKVWNFFPNDESIILLVEAKKGFNNKVPYTINFISKQADNIQEIEPNDSEEQAVPITIGQTKKGYISPQNDIDYYKIINDQDKIIDFYIELETLSNLDINFMIINKTTNTSKFINFSTWGGKETLSYLASNKGDYYLRITGSTNSAIRKDPLYYLSIKELGQNDDKLNYYEREFNDSPEIATEIIPGEEIEGILLNNDQDWFKLDLIEKAISFDLSLSQFSGKNAQIEVYNNQLKMIAKNDHPTSLSIRDLNSGRYYIKLYHNDSRQSFYRLFTHVRRQ